MADKPLIFIQGGTRTPVVYTIVGSRAGVKTFDRRLRQAIQRLSGLIASYGPQTLLTACDAALVS
jgi:hypothetical protein